MAKGFFTKKETEAKGFECPRITGCKACKLHREAITPKIPVQGKGEQRILIVGEIPSVKQDKSGNIMTGDGSKLLFDVLRRNGINLDRDCWKTNAVRCRPENGEPDALSVDNCRAELWKFIKDKKPRLIILLGNLAVTSFIGHRWKHGKLGGINRWRGFVIPDRDSGCFVAPMYHPNHILQTADKQPVNSTIFKQDMKRALKFLKEDFPKWKDEAKDVRILEGAELRLYLMKLGNSEFGRFAFDYETTGLKPQREGHEIVSCAIADEGGAVTFDFPKDKRTLSLLQKIMETKHIEKVAHNNKYEDTWTHVIAGFPVHGWLWDTMLTAHILDNRSGVSGLKFQLYVHFGIMDYDSHVSHYLRGVDEKDANSFNRIKECPREERLIYGGIDALGTWRLFQLQQKEIGIC